MRLNSFAKAAFVLFLGAHAIAKQVKTGLEVLRESNYAQLSGRKVIILSNPTGVTPELDLGIDAMFDSGAVDLVGVMGPEHGFRGTAQAGSSADTFVDEKTGLTVYDAYNADTATLKSYIEKSGADTVVFDIQDVGALFYTSAQSNAKFVVLDRPNPITGLDAFGPVLNRSVASYVGRQPIAQAHGMTAGELAKMFVAEQWIKEASNGSDLELEVIKMDGWKRWMTWEDTGLPWVLPSPNMPTVDTATIYPGSCLFEGTSISEGRGTTRPYEMIGAPYTNASWSDTMRSLKIPYTTYRPACFSPTAYKFASEIACGVQTYVSLQNEADHKQFDPVYVGVSLLWAAKRLYTSNTGNETQSFHWLQSEGSYTVDRLAGGTMIRESIDAGLTPGEIKDRWQSGLEEFRNKREKYLLYN